MPPDRRWAASRARKPAGRAQPPRGAPFTTY